jgi:hypothetical protein
MLNVFKKAFCRCEMRPYSSRYIEVLNHEPNESQYLYENVEKCFKCGKVVSQFIEVEKRRKGKYKPADTNACMQ